MIYIYYTHIEKGYFWYPYVSAIFKQKPFLTNAPHRIHPPISERLRGTPRVRYKSLPASVGISYWRLGISQTAQFVWWRSIVGQLHLRNSHSKLSKWGKKMKKKNLRSRFEMKKDDLSICSHVVSKKKARNGQLVEKNRTSAELAAAKRSRSPSQVRPWGFWGWTSS